MDPQDSQFSPVKSPLYIIATRNGASFMKSSSEKEIINLVESVSRSLMGDDPAHGWPHVERVRRLAWMIVEGEGVSVDRLVLELSVLLHDVGRNLPGPGHHAEKSAVFARQLLRLAGLDDEVIGKVVHAILAHSFSLGVRAETVEAMVLSDADKLDALGAIGIARVFHTGCQLGRGFQESLEHFYNKIVQLPSRMYLQYSREVALQRVRIVEEFASIMSREMDAGKG